MKIYITRHGETEWNKAGRMQVWKNSNLSEKGIENAKKLGESFEELLCRTRQALNENINNTEHENVLIVSHAILIKAIYAIVKNYSLEDLWNPPFMHDTCLTVLEVKGTEVSIILEADVSHLD